jgi:hypothetical protein
MLQLAFGGLDEECDYYKVEQKVLNVSINRGNLFKAFYSPNMPSPKSVEVHYLLEGTGQPVATGECPNETWFWLSSAIYFIIPPTDLNTFALHILGPLAPLTGALDKSVDIRIPAMDDRCYFNNLHQLTMTVSRK